MASNMARVIPLPRDARRDGAKEVVAVVLSDGSVRRLDGNEAERGSDWNSGQISGDDWVLWWQRRSFAPR